MKMIGYTNLSALLEAGAHAPIYMRSTVQTSGGKEGLVWKSYQILVQAEVGDNVLYWLLELGAEPEGVPADDPISRSRLAHSAAKCVERYLDNLGVKPQEAMISYPKDLVLFGGEYNDFMRYNKNTKDFELL